MARPRKKTVVEANPLLEALQFLSLITKDVGSPNETHVILANHTATAFNGVIAASTSIPEDLFACPHNTTLVNALSKCGQNYSITKFDDNLQIKSNKFKAIVPCLDVTLLQNTIPDAPVAPINDDFKTAIESVGILANENAQTVIAASILMNGQSVVATDRNVMFEYWHGLNLPSSISLPKAIVAPLTKTNKKLSQFGFSSNSCTFHFEDGAWLKTQLYSEQWPNVGRILNVSAKPFPVPADLWAALEAVAPFSSDGLLYTRGDGLLCSASTDHAGASFQVAGLPSGLTLSARQMALIKPWATSICWFANDGKMIMAYGDKMRAAIAGRQ